MRLNLEFEDYEIDAAIRAGIKVSDLYEIALLPGKNSLTAADIEAFFRAALVRLLKFQEQPA